jgi:PQQ-like domain
MTSISISAQNPGWDDRTIGSPVYAQPIYYENRNGSNLQLFPVLYFCERDGILYQKDARFGTTYWTLNLEFPVEADMAVSENGNLLYVGDTNGNLHAVRVASQSTTAPTLAPIGPPTPAPVLAVVPTNAPTTVMPVTAPVAVVPPVGTPTGAPELKPVEPAPATTTVITASPVMSPPQAASPPAPVALPPAQVAFPTSDVSNNQDKSDAKAKSGTLVYLVFGLVLLGLICCVLGVLFQCRRRCRNNNNGRLVTKKSAESTAKTTAADDDRVSDEEKQLHEAYEHECAENERLTIIELAESPIKMSNSRQRSIDRSVTSWDTASTKTPTHNTLTSIEETPEAEDDRKSSGDDNKSLGYEVATDLSVSQHMMMDDSSLLDGMMSGAEDGPENLRKHVDQMKNNKGIAASLAESTDALAKAVGAAVAAISTWDNDKKETDSVKSREGSGRPQMRRVKSTGSDYSTPTQPGKIRSIDRNRTASPSDMISVDSSSIYLDEPSIHSMDRILKNSAVEDAVLGKAEPAPKDCPEDEGRGVLRPGSAYLSRYNEKKEMDLPPEFDGGVGSRSDPRNNGNVERIQSMYNGVSVRPAGRSGAGIFSRRQPQMNNNTDDEEDDEPSPETQQKLPVKLGPKRSDILRSQKPSYDDEESGTGQPPQFTAHGYYEEPEEIANTVSLDSEDLPAPAPGPAERVRRSSKSKKRTTGQQPVPSDQRAHSPNTSLTMADPWGSFLSELSKVETSFFSTSGLLAGRNTAEEQEDEGDDATAEESNNSAMSPPPAPRTFYA